MLAVTSGVGVQRQLRRSQHAPAGVPALAQPPAHLLDGRASDCDILSFKDGRHTVGGNQLVPDPGTSGSGVCVVGQGWWVQVPAGGR
jgi:hypothetical protein